MDPNETVFMHIICDYVYVIRAFLPSLPGGRRYTHPGVKLPPASHTFFYSGSGRKSTLLATKPKRVGPGVVLLRVAH